MPNNGNNDTNYDVYFSSGVLTQDIVAGVIINQLFMSGGTLVLANPLTLEVGLQFSGGAITSGILNIAGLSSQSALMTVSNSTLNNSGDYDLVLNGNAFSGGGSVFNNSGTLTAHATDGTVTFNIPLSNTGSVSAEVGAFVLTGGGSNSGTLAAASGAVLEFGSNFTLTDGTQFSGDGVIQFDNNTTTTLSGTITNNANVLLNSTGSFTDFVLNGDVTFSGSGVLTLQNADRIRGSGTFINAGNTINGWTNGSGTFGNNEIGIVNQSGGVIDANVPGLSLNVDPNSGLGLTNTGIMQASNGGILLLNGNGGGGFNNVGGSITALDGSQVQFVNGAVITGGILSSFGSGAIHNVNTATFVSLTNVGTFIGDNGSTTTIVGTLANTGSIILNSMGNFTDFALSGDVTLEGGGTVSLMNADRVFGSGTLTNVDNIIQGETSNTGGLGYNAIGLINETGGLIDANVAGLALNVDPSASAGMINQGTMEASNGGILLLNGNGGGGIDNTGGAILALDGSTVQLTAGIVITGGTLNTIGSGTIHNISSATLDSLTNAGAFIADNGTTTNLSGTITDTGSITINSTGNFTDLAISGDVTLTGGNVLTLSNAARVLGGGTLFIGGSDGSAFTVQGETSNTGGLGYNELAIVNRSGGLINANAVDGNNNGLALVVDPRQGGDVTNLGTMQASDGGILLLTGNGGGVFNNAGGRIQALNGSQVQLTAGATINNGTLMTVGTGSILNLNTATLNTLTLVGTFNSTNSSTTTVLGTLTNMGVISLNSVGNFTDFVLTGNLTLTGGGTINLTNADRVLGSGVLTNINNLIQGDTNNTGGLGYNELGIVNQASGVINANNNGLALIIDPDATDGLLNQGLIEASAGGILRLTGNGGGAFNNAGAVIEALDGSLIQLTAGATINNGALMALGTGSIVNLDTTTLNALTLAGAFNANNSTTTTLIGTITNTGVISINSTGNFTDLALSGDVTLTGGGTINLTNADRILGSGILTNTNNLIQGDTNNTGGLGYNLIGIINQTSGVINANNNGLVLTVDPDSANGLVNHGLMEASNGGILLLTGNGGGGFTNTGAAITAQTGSTIQLVNGASITGGTLSAVGTGSIVNLNAATLNALTLAGAFNAPNTTTTTLNGAIVNTGSISLNSTGNFTDLVLGSNVTLSGGGVINLVNADRIYGNGILTNTNNTIQGETHSGSLGNNGIGIVNQTGGLINANVSGLTLNVDPDSTDGLVNQGTMEASNGGIFLLNGNGGGSFTNSGTIVASGGTLQFSGTVTSSGTVDVGSDSLSVSGSYTQTAGTFRLAGGTVTSSSALNFMGGLIDARGTMTAGLTNSANLQPALGGSGLAVTGAVSLLSASQLTFQLGGLTQGSEYGFLNVNGTVALGGQLVLSFVNGFQNLVTGSDIFTVVSASSNFTGAFSNVASGTRLLTSDGFGTFVVTYSGSNVVLSNFIAGGLAPLSFAGSNSTTGNGGNGGTLNLTAPAITFGLGSGEIPGAYFSGGNAPDGSAFIGGDGGTLAITATTGDIVVGADIEASTGSSGADVPAGKGGSVTLTANTGTVTVNNRIQVSHNIVKRRSATGGTIALKSGRTSGVAINVSNTGQLLSLLDAAAPGPGGKIIIQATAPTGNSQVNVSGTLQADRGTVDIRNSGSSGQINLTNANIHADAIKAAALGSNGVLQVGGGSLSADTTLQLYATSGNGQVVFVGNVSLNGNSTKSIAGNSVTIRNGVLVNVTGPKASVYVNSTGSIPNANYSGFGGNGHTNGTFGGSGANPPQPLSNAPPLGLPPSG